VKSSRTEGAVVVRPYEQEDEPRVLELLTMALGSGPVGNRPPEFFRWKHVQNPFGPSFLMVAVADGRIIGLRAFMRWRLRSGERTLNAVRAVDTATHPEYQRRGVFSLLTRSALEALTEEVDLVFNTPNERSIGGYLKMGWVRAGAVPVSIRVRRPIRFARGLGSVRDSATPVSPPPAIEAERADDVLADEPRLADLLVEDGHRDDRLKTRRDPTYLRWRYGSASGLDYRAVRHSQGSSLRGLTIFRVRPRGRLWESTVSEVIVGPGDHRTARGLLRDVAQAARVDHLACHVPAGSAAAAAVRRSGFLPTPGGIVFTVNVLRSGLSPSPTDLRSWALSLGDVEVF
jgi:GNAT superfamily N-acetyltransferase